MRLPIFEVFFTAVSLKESRSSLAGELSLEKDRPDLLFSSLSLETDLLLPTLPLEDFDNEEEEEEGEALFGGVREDAVFLLATCFDGPPAAVLLHSRLVGAGLSSPYSDKSSSSWRAISATEGDARDADLGLISRNLSSMDRCGQPPPPPSPNFEASLPSEEEPVGLGSMDEVALCLRFIDLLRHDLPAVGEGMAEASCCPLRLAVTEPPRLPLPFIPPGTETPLTDSAAEKKLEQKVVILGPIKKKNSCQLTVQQNVFSLDLISATV